MTGRAVDTTRLSNDAMNSAIPVMTTAHTARDLVRSPSVRAPRRPPSPRLALVATDAGVDPARGAAAGSASVVAGAACSAPMWVPGRPERRPRRVHPLVD